MAGNELKWVVVGYHTDKLMNDALAFLEETGAQAEAKCMALYPNFEIYFIKRDDTYES